MEDWKKYRLGNLFERITRKNTNLESSNVLTISAQYGLINQEEFFNKSVASKNLTNYYLLEKGDFAYNKSYSSGYPMGATKVLEKYEDGIVSTLYICFRNKSNLVNNEYFKYYFESKQYYDELSKIAQEGARNHGLLNVSSDDFFNIEILLPSVKEQEKIVRILSNMEKILNNIDEKIKNTKIQRNIYSNKIFNERLLNCQNKKMEEIAEIYQPQTISQNKLVEDGKYKVFGANGYIGMYNEYNHKLDQVCISCRGAKSGNVNYVKGPVWITGNSMVCNIDNSEKIDKLFLYYQLKDKNFNKYISGGAQPQLTQKELKKVQIKILEINEQIRIRNTLKKIDDIIEKLENKKNEYMLMNKYLMQKLLTGKIRVKI